MTIDVLKVSSKSNPNSVAGALAGVVRSDGSVEIQVVGAGALNQAIKAIAIARGYMATSGLDLNCRPTFADIRIDGESRTAIRLHVEGCAMGATSPTAIRAAGADGHRVDSDHADEARTGGIVAPGGSPASGATPPA